ncbi:MAG TPA: hypothetical protein VLB86_07060 [Gaiellaceae bacterium]|nr:hypothetical protein [Gaiellaceae bacterium]
MTRRSPADMQKAKEARQKKIAAVGGVLLLAVVAFQAPRTMKLLNGAEETAAAPPAVTAPAATTATPAAAGGGTVAAPAGGGDAAVASDVSPEPGGGQLVSFTRFASKDPFVQQIDPSAAVPAATAGSGAAGGGKAPASGAATGTRPSGGAAAGTASSGDSARAPGSATIAVNDVEETVAVGGDFPAAAPLFRLVKLTASAAQVAIAGGSYASGEQTATLRRGRTLVLQNTADGTSYELRLVDVA